MGRSIAFVLLLCAGRAFGASAELSARAGEAAFWRGLSGAVFQPADQPVYTLDLSKLLDNSHATSTAFKAGTTTVHVFGDQADNTGNWFMGVAPEGGTTRLYNALKMVHVLGLGPSTRFEAGGKKLAAHVTPAIPLLQSRLVIESDEGQGDKKVAEYTAEKLATAAYLAGYPLSLGGKFYRLLYFRKFDEGPDGRFKGFNGKRAVVLMTSDGTAYHFYESDIPTDKVVYQTPSGVDGDGKRVTGLTLALRLPKTGQLEIYLPPKK